MERPPNARRLSLERINLILPAALARSRRRAPGTPDSTAARRVTTGRANARRQRGGSKHNNAAAP
eukprot:4154941-Lingulodinium_polyedra.AAC.1